MKTHRKYFLVILFALASLAVAQDKPARKTQDKPAAAPITPVVTAGTNSTTAADFPVIGYIEKRGRTIVIKSGPKGPVYSVKTTDGKVLFENLSAEQLRAQAPELHEFIKTAVAGNSGHTGTAIDASLGMMKR